MQKSTIRVSAQPGMRRNQGAPSIPNSSISDYTARIVHGRTFRSPLTSTRNIARARLIRQIEHDLDSKHGLSNIVCFGGHRVSREEQEVAVRVGNALGQRGWDITTGGGSGVMEGAMAGAAEARLHLGQSGGENYALTEPEIHAKETANSFVTKLTVLRNIEERLEGFTLIGDAFLFLPGGVGTLEELMFLLATLFHPQNEGKEAALPVAIVADHRDPNAAAFSNGLRRFLGTVFGVEAQQLVPFFDVSRLDLLVKWLESSLTQAEDVRQAASGDLELNSSLHVDKKLAIPFKATHDRVRALDLVSVQPKWRLAVELRRVFATVVSAGVREDAKKRIADQGPFLIRGDRVIIEALRTIVADLAKAGRLITTDGFAFATSSTM